PDRRRSGDPPRGGATRGRASRRALRRRRGTLVPASARRFDLCLRQGPRGRADSRARRRSRAGGRGRAGRARDVPQLPASGLLARAAGRDAASALAAERRPPPPVPAAPRRGDGAGGDPAAARRGAGRRLEPLAEHPSVAFEILHRVDAVADARLLRLAEDRRPGFDRTRVVCLDVAHLDEQAVDHPRVVVHLPLEHTALPVLPRAHVARRGGEEDRRSLDVDLGVADHAVRAGVASVTVLGRGERRAQPVDRGGRVPVAEERDEPLRHYSPSPSQLSSRSRRSRRKRPARAPSTRRWSYVSVMFISGRIAITSLPSSSSTTHGRLTSAYVPRIADCGWLMTGVPWNVP